MTNDRTLPLKLNYESTHCLNMTTATILLANCGGTSSSDESVLNPERFERRLTAYNNKIMLAYEHRKKLLKV